MQNKIKYLSCGDTLKHLPLLIIVLPHHLKKKLNQKYPVIKPQDMYINC